MPSARRRVPAVCRTLIIPTLVALLWSASPASGQGGQAPPASSPDATQLEEQISIAPVSIDGAVLFSVRGTSSFPPAERAKAIADRIRTIAANPAIAPDAVRVTETDLFSRIEAERQIVMNVFDADASLEGVQRQVLARLHQDKIRSAIAAYRAERTQAAMQRAAFRSAGATTIFALLAVLVIWLRRRLDAILERRYRQRLEALAAKSKDVVSAAAGVWDRVRALLRGVRTVAIAVLVFFYFDYVLALFPHTRPAGQSLAGYVIGPVATMWASLLAQVPDLVFLAILVIVVRIILRLIQRFFEAIEQGRIHLANFDRDWAAPTYKLVRPLVVAFALVVGYPYIPGSESDAFKGVSLFLGIVFSLGSSSFIANMIAGYSMTYRRAFRVGDVVKIGDVMGVVSAVRLQVTQIRTIKNEEVVVPNSQILNEAVVNYSTLAQTSGLILHTTVGIGYETPWRQVEAMLLEAARRTPGLKPEPRPFVLQLQLGDFCVTYELNVACGEPTRMRAVYTDLHRHILDVFNEYGVQIMTPAYEGDPEIPKVVPKDQWYLAPARSEGEKT